MKKVFAFVLVMMVVTLVPSTFASAATQIYHDYSLDNKNYEDHELKTYEIVVYDYDGFRASLEVNMNEDSEEEMNQKMFNWSYEVGYHVTSTAQTTQDMIDHVYFITATYDGKPVFVARCNGLELLEEMTGQTWTKGEETVNC